MPKKSIEVFYILVMEHRYNSKKTLMMLACVNVDKGMILNNRLQHTGTNKM